LEVELNRADLD